MSFQISSSRVFKVQNVSSVIPGQVQEAPHLFLNIWQAVAVVVLLIHDHICQHFKCYPRCCTSLRLLCCLLWFWFDLIWFTACLDGLSSTHSTHVTVSLSELVFPCFYGSVRSFMMLGDSCVFWQWRGTHLQLNIIYFLKGWEMAIIKEECGLSEIWRLWPQLISVLLEPEADFPVTAAQPKEALI